MSVVNYYCDAKKISKDYDLDAYFELLKQKMSECFPGAKCSVQKLGEHGGKSVVSSSADMPEDIAEQVYKIAAEVWEDFINEQ